MQSQIPYSVDFTGFFQWCSVLYINMANLNQGLIYEIVGWLSEKRWLSANWMVSVQN
jgi:hypothetical protein